MLRQGTVRLDQSGIVAANASGVGTLILGPVRPFRRWTFARTNLSVSGSSLVPSATIYRNTAIDPNRIDGTNNATNNVSTVGAVLVQGESLVVVFLNVTPGALCFVSISGDDDGWQ